MNNPCCHLKCNATIAISSVEGYTLNMQICPLEKDDLADIKQLIDKSVGEDYLSISELFDMYEQSLCQGRMCSFTLKDAKNQLFGLRLTFPPGKWKPEVPGKLSQNKWPHKFEDTAYFKIIVVDAQVSGQGLGKKLSKKSIEVLKQCGAKGIVCHSWKQSPHNSSRRYLEGLGFEEIAEYPSFWAGHACAICETDSCQCTAVEMYLDLEK